MFRYRHGTLVRCIKHLDAKRTRGADVNIVKMALKRTDGFQVVAILDHVRADSLAGADDHRMVVADTSYQRLFIQVERQMNRPNRLKHLLSMLVNRRADKGLRNSSLLFRLAKRDTGKLAFRRSCDVARWPGRKAESREIDVAAADQDANTRTFRHGIPSGEQWGKGNRGARLDNNLQPRPDKFHRCQDVRFGHRCHVGNEATHDFQIPSANRARAQPIGHGLRDRFQCVDASGTP